MSDELFDRLRAADPVSRTTPVEAADTFRTRSLMEEAMASDLTRKVQGPRWIPVAIGAGAVAAAVGGVLLLGSGLGNDPATVGLRLSLPGAAGTSMTSCIQFSVAELARMPLAFAGTVTGVEGSAVDLSVDTWYSGGEASTVEVSAPEGASTALLGGEIQFVVGEQYLITATGGFVNLCGFSGASTPELRSAFEAAF